MTLHFYERSQVFFKQSEIYMYDIAFLSKVVNFKQSKIYDIAFLSKVASFFEQSDIV
jgi:hypothetical protein